MSRTIKIVFAVLLVVSLFFLVIHGRHHWGWTFGGPMGGMMGGGMMSDMMGNFTIPGSPPPSEQSPRLKPGYELAGTFCTQCHALPDPGLHSHQEWPGVLQRMQGHISEFNRSAPSQNEWQQIQQYYQERSR